MEKPIKFILLIALLGTGLSAMIMQKKTNDQLYTLQTCPYRNHFIAQTSDSCEVFLQGAIIYDYNVVDLDEAKMGDAFVQTVVREIILQYTNAEVFNMSPLKIEDAVNERLLEYNDKLTWRIYFISGHKSNHAFDTLTVKIN